MHPTLIEAAASPQVELSLVFTAGVQNDAALLREYDRQLLPEERSQRDRYHFERDRLRCTLTRIALREVLSRHAPVPVGEWRFGKNAWNKPHVEHPPQHADLSFNVSHTDGLVLIGVTRQRSLGVDVERPTRDAHLDLAERFFSAREATALRALPPSLQRRRFFELWTLKEAYIKARGMGLSIALDRFGFELDRDPQGLELDIDALLADFPARWHFSQIDAGPEHLAAVCVQCAPGEVPALAAWRLLPGVSREMMPVLVTRSSARPAQPQ